MATDMLLHTFKIHWYPGKMECLNDLEIDERLLKCLECGVGTSLRLAKFYILFILMHLFFKFQEKKN